MIRHTIIASVYALIAVTAAFVVSENVAQAGLEFGISAGGLVFVGCALGHEMFTRRSEGAALVEEIRHMRDAQTEVMGELSRARHEVGLIGEALAQAGPGKSSRALENDVSEVVAEVRMLQTLVDQLSSNAVAASAEAGSSDKPSRLSLAPVARDLSDDQILEIIRDGLRRDRVDLVYQPIVSLPQRKREFYEAFTRIRADGGSVIVPEQYIAIAEREGLIAAIDNMLLFRCVQLLRRTRAKDRNFGFFCNISPYTLADHDFFSEFIEFMGENRELAANLIFEFGQPMIMNGDEDIEKQLTRLARLGFRFSMDQVSSLSLDYAKLAVRHFKFIKIDARALLDQITDPELASTLLGLKKTLDRHGIDLIVEKIESEPMLVELLDLNIDFGQGYLFGEPRESRSA